MSQRSLSNLISVTFNVSQFGGIFDLAFLLAIRYIIETFANFIKIREI